ncbi:MAG: 4-hydroxy-3-methylbut-2-enyl diphosphate reductase, partial [Verrucomicrobiota bacterium]|nr:4-hydroxy-3-methylbut-2-enyl diphosphate reductase [Verrucomicrobiota bacterium]
REKIESKGCQFIDTTCGDVMSVWKRVRNYAKEEVTSIIHGKASHEETMATSSQAISRNGHYLVVNNFEETDVICHYIKKGGNKTALLERFQGCYSEGFDPDLHLQVVGVANQTTMMRGETEEVQRRIRSAIEKRYGAENVHSHFRFFDTICGATQDRQDALNKMLSQPMDLLLVIGGYNSSNTSHLAEMGERVLPTYFIKNAGEIGGAERIRHWNQHTQQVEETRNWLPEDNIIIGITAGASCPNNLIEDVIARLFNIRGSSIDQLHHFN